MMDNSTIQLKIKQRLNKLASSDFDNIECWQVVEAFNKGMSNWVRRQLHGTNLKQTGDEQSKRRIDDMQIILTDKVISLQKKDLYFESDELPDDYLQWKRISGAAFDKCCNEPRNMLIYLAEEANVDELLRDKMKQPSYGWGETFCTLKNNRVRIYTNNEFDIPSATLSYYRQPRRIEITGCASPYIITIPTVDVACEFKDDIVEVLIDEAINILAGDIESINQLQISAQKVEQNN
jgi:hypothetical protein